MAVSCAEAPILWLLQFSLVPHLPPTLLEQQASLCFSTLSSWESLHLLCLLQKEVSLATVESSTHGKVETEAFRRQFDMSI